MTKDKRENLIVSAVVWLTLILACIGVVSSVMWNLKAREVASLKLKATAQTAALQTMADEVADSRHKIEQANRMLAMAYPKAGMVFISE